MIDFTLIRGGTVDGQRASFEHLVCQLARLDGSGGEFRRIEGVGGDGGVEAVRLLPNGSEIGYQAKYYTSRDHIDWTKIDDSVKTALTQHPQLTRYVIALPCDFTGTRATRGGSTDGIWGKWDTQVQRWQALATNAGMSVVFEPWTAFELEAALLQPAAQHLIRFFFDRLTFTREWMRRHLERTIHDLQARYSPDEHVDTEALKAFDVIFRRQNVRQDLHAVFELARHSNPRAAVALLTDPTILEADVVAAADLQTQFVELGDAVDANTGNSWPVCEWSTSWYSFTRQLHNLHNSIAQGLGIGPTYDSSAVNLAAEATKVYDLLQPEVFGGHWSHLLPVDGARAGLLLGRAGAGKSHSLARGAEMAWNEGVPVVHILGQHILDDDPRASILKRLELTDWSFHDALSALNLAAEAAGTRALLIIDALNEGRGTDVWRGHLASFLREVNQHERIVLVVSCREEYLTYVVPPEVVANPRSYPREDGQPPEDCAPLGKLVTVRVQGFRTREEQERALQKFMDAKGIARPTAPVLDPEFFNPLFMSSVCRSMAKAGIKVFPRGLHGARELFRFVLETKAKALGTRHDGTDRVFQSMQAALGNLCRDMVERQADCVPLPDAMDLIDVAFRAFPLSGQTWFSVLEGADIVRRDVEKSPRGTDVWSYPKEVVRFSFQRLQDNLIAEHLIQKCDDADIEKSFESEAMFSFLIRRYAREDGETELKFARRWVGVLSALWAAVAEKYNRELPDLESFFGGPNVYFYPDEFRSVFLASVRERKATAFTHRTKDILDRLCQDGYHEKKLEILLSTSCVPEHAWNADFLADRLLSLSPDDRQEAWSKWFADDASGLTERAIGIIDWALNVRTETADHEVIRLVAITLTCLYATSEPSIRDQATQGLANLLAGEPSMLYYLEDRFSAINASYVRECLSAARSPINKTPSN